MNFKTSFRLMVCFLSPWLLLGFFSWSALAQVIPIKPEPAHYVNDYADLMTATDINLLETKLKGYFDSTSTQIVIVRGI